MTETPEEMYARFVALINPKTLDTDMRDLFTLINHYRSQVTVLREACDGGINQIVMLNDIYDVKNTLEEALEATADKWSE